MMQSPTVGLRRLTGFLPLIVLTLLVTPAAAIGLSNNHHSAAQAPTHRLIGTAPACAAPTVTDIDGLGLDATWNTTVDDLTHIGQSLTVDALDTTVNSVQVIIGDPSLIADPTQLSPSNPDVLANAVASIEDTANNLINLITDLVFSPPDTGSLPVYVLIDYTPAAECVRSEDGDPGVGQTAVPVGTLVVGP